jgi:hypothetical protein
MLAWKFVAEPGVTESSEINEPGIEKRRSTRITNVVPIIVTGTDALGQSFQESTTTVMVNCYGCKYQSTHYAPKNSVVTIEIRRTGLDRLARTVSGRVIWVQRPRNYRELYHVGMEFDVPGNVWGIASPPEDWFPVPGDEPPAKIAVIPFAEREHSAKSQQISGGNGPAAVATMAATEEMLMDCIVETITLAEGKKFPVLGRESGNAQVTSLQEIAKAAAEEAIAGQMAMLRQEMEGHVRGLIEKSVQEIIEQQMKNQEVKSPAKPAAKRRRKTPAQK